MYCMGVITCICDSDSSITGWRMEDAYMHVLYHTGTKLQGVQIFVDFMVACLPHNII